MLHDAIETDGKILFRPRDLGRIFLEDRVHRLDGRCALKRALARDHLVENAAVAEDVGSVVGGLPADLLGRHVSHRAHDDAGAGFELRGRFGHLRRGRERADRAHELRQAEIQDLQSTVGGDEEILRFEIPVDDALLVRGGQPLGELSCIVDRLARREIGAGHFLAQRLTFEQLGHDVGRSCVRADVINDQDVWMIELAGGARFLFEALQTVGIAHD